MANIMGLSTTVENLRERNTAMRVESELSAHMSNGFSVIGINVNHIVPMQQAIDAYVADITAKLDQIAEDYDPDIAFKGTEIHSSLISYMEEAKEISLNIVTYLKAFSNQLNEIRAAYESNDSTNASRINERRSSLESSYNGAYATDTNASNNYSDSTGSAGVSQTAQGGYTTTN